VGQHLLLPRTAGKTIRGRTTARASTAAEHGRDTGNHHCRPTEDTGTKAKPTWAHNPRAREMSPTPVAGSGSRANWPATIKAVT